MATASIKGSVLRGLVQETATHLATGRIDRAVAERILRPADFDLLDSGVSEAVWYDIGAYERLSELLRAELGGGAASYIRERGAQVAERLIAVGVYQQVDFLKRIGRSDTADIAFQNLKLTATLWNSFFNFGTWTVQRFESGPDFRMDVTDAAAMPTIAWDAVEGFIARLAFEVDSEGIRVIREELGTDGMRFTFHLLRDSIVPRR